MKGHSAGFFSKGVIDEVREWERLGILFNSSLESGDLPQDLPILSSSHISFYSCVFMGSYTRYIYHGELLGLIR